MIVLKNDRGPQKNISGLFTNCHDCRGMQIVQYQRVYSSRHCALEQFCFAQVRGSLAEALRSLLECHIYIDSTDASTSHEV